SRAPGKPSPACATIATRTARREPVRSRRPPRRVSGGRRSAGTRPEGALLLLAEIGVGLVEPVFPWWVEHVHVEGILECAGLVRHMARQVQHLARANHDLLGSVRTYKELECPFQDVRELLVLVRVSRDHAPFFQVDVREHHAVARDQAPRQPLVQLLARNVLPSIPCRPALVAHRSRSRRRPATTLYAARRAVKARPSPRILAHAQTPDYLRHLSPQMEARGCRSPSCCSRSSMPRWPPRGGCLNGCPTGRALGNRMPSR